MANFTEQPRRFNPYIQQLPIDAYASVGLQRQQQYNAGVQQVSAYVGALSGQEVVRDVDRQYLDNQVNALTSRLNEVASADWSSQALVAQAGSLAGRIYSDPNIRSAVAGTQKYLKDEADIADAKKNGKWAPENEWYLRRQMAGWLGDPTPGATYQTDGYQPYVDVAADMLKAWKDIKPNATLVQKPNGQFSAYETVSTPVTGADGKTLLQTETKELPPDEVAAQINAIINDTQRQQLGISALYHYRNVNASASMQKLVDQHFSRHQKYLDDLLATAQLDKTLHAGDSSAQEAISARMNSIEKSKNELASSISAYKAQAITNPDAVKSSIYYQDWLSGISEMIGYSDVSNKLVDNPGFKARMEELKTWAALKRATRGSSSRKGKEGDGGDENPWTPQSGVVLPISEQERADVNLNDFIQKAHQLMETRTQKTNALLYRHFGNRLVNHIYKDINNDGVAEEIFQVKPGMEEEVANVTDVWWNQYRKGDPNLDITISETLSELDEKNLLLARLLEVSADVSSKASKYVKGLPVYQQAQAAMQTFNTLPSTVIGGETITPADVKNYIKLRDEKMVSTPSLGTGAPGGTYMPALKDEEIGHYGLNRKKFDALQAADNGRGSATDTRSLEHYLEVMRPGIAKQNALDKARDTFIHDEVQKYKGFFNQVVLNVPSAKADQMRPVANFVQTLVANAKQTGMGGATHWSSVREMVGEKHAAETVYGYVQDREGNVRIRISNVDVDKGRPQEIVVDSRTAQINHLVTPDPLATTRSLLDLGEGLRTGSNFYGSIPLNNGRTGKYTVRHEVENFGGRYKVKLYVTDNSTTDAAPHPIPINNTLFADWNKLTEFLMNDVSERFIDSMLSANSRGSANTTGGTDSTATPMLPPGFPPIE